MFLTGVSWAFFLAQGVPRSGFCFRGVEGSACGVVGVVFDCASPWVASFRVSFAFGASCTVGCVVSGTRARFAGRAGGVSANDTFFLV